MNRIVQVALLVGLAALLATGCGGGKSREQVKAETLARLQADCDGDHFCLREASGRHALCFENNYGGVPGLFGALLFESSLNEDAYLHCVNTFSNPPSREFFLAPDPDSSE